MRRGLISLLLISTVVSVFLTTDTTAQSDKSSYTPDLTKAQTLEYSHETIVVPERWQTAGKTKNLIRAQFSYQKKPESTCSSNVLWADFVIQTDIAPCLNPDESLYTFVRFANVDNVPGKMYRHKTGKTEDDFMPGGSSIILTLNRYKRCYVMTFTTCEKWVPRFFPDFKLIMDNFRAKK